MVESKVERISFTPKREVLILGAPNKFTLRDKPECSILRPQRLMSNSPCRGFVWITRMMFGDQIHLEAPVGSGMCFSNHVPALRRIHATAPEQSICPFFFGR